MKQMRISVFLFGIVLLSTSIGYTAATQTNTFNMPGWFLHRFVNWKMTPPARQAPSQLSAPQGNALPSQDGIIQLGQNETLNLPRLTKGMSAEMTNQAFVNIKKFSDRHWTVFGDHRLPGTGTGRSTRGLQYDAQPFSAGTGKNLDAAVNETVFSDSRLPGTGTGRSISGLQYDVQLFSAGTGKDFDAAVNDNGNVIVVSYTSGKPGLYYSQYIGGQWNGVQVVPGVQGNIYVAHVDINENGDAVVVWGVRGDNSGVFANMLKNNSWVGVNQLSNPSQRYSVEPTVDLSIQVGPRVKMNALGHAVVVWSQQAIYDLSHDAWANVYVPDQGWTGPVKLENMPSVMVGPVVARTSNNDLLTVWLGGRTDVYSRRYLASSNTWEDVVTAGSVKVQDQQVDLTSSDGTTKTVQTNISKPTSTEIIRLDITTNKTRLEKSGFNNIMWGERYMNSNISYATHYSLAYSGYEKKWYPLSSAGGGKVIRAERFQYSSSWSGGLLQHTLHEIYFQLYNQSYCEDISNLEKCSTDNTYWMTSNYYSVRAVNDSDNLGAPSDLAHGLFSENWFDKDHPAFYFSDRLFCINQSSLASDANENFLAVWTENTIHPQVTYQGGKPTLDIKDHNSKVTIRSSAFVGDDSLDSGGSGGTWGNIIDISSIDSSDPNVCPGGLKLLMTSGGDGFVFWSTNGQIQGAIFN